MIAYGTDGKDGRNGSGCQIRRTNGRGRLPLSNWRWDALPAKARMIVLHEALRNAVADYDKLMRRPDL